MPFINNLMPTYYYKCSQCEHSFEDFYRIADRETPITEPCPNCKEEGSVELVICAVALCSPIAMGLVKPKGDFKERMRQIKENHKKVRSLDGKIKEY